MKTMRTVPGLGTPFFDINKYGINVDVDGSEDLWNYGGTKTHRTTAATLYISSDDETNDVGIEITVGYIDADGAAAFVTGNLDAVDARVFVSLGVTGFAVNRAWVSGDGEQITGNVYISSDNTDAGGDGIPDTITTLEAFLEPADQNTMQAILYIPNEMKGRKVHGAWVFGYYADIHGNVAAASTVRFRKLEPSGSWRTVESRGITNSFPVNRRWPKAQFFTAGTIIKLDTVAGDSNLNMTGGFDLELAV
ncbi:MAG: hypothetical protein JRE40_00135 [Deltaproteobacteria bacterium]|nr:hypothetical protein [Deltaproteobacteria bacterium]